MEMDEDGGKERELKKKAIFDGMAKRGQERILRVGYDNWDPFQEPKDPRERVFSSASRMATALVEEFYQSRGGQEESVSMHKELFELCRGILQQEPRALTMLDFCGWYREKSARSD